MRTEVKLENGTVLRVGETYLVDGWSDEERVKISVVGDTKFLAHTINGWEEVYHIEEDWIPYEEPKKDKWYKVLAQTHSGNSRQTAYVKSVLDSHILLKEYSSEEEMINDLKKYGEPHANGGLINFNNKFKH
jgi:hypothetical protein